ncbi:hypothetical protein QBC44DRAFT_235129 [Cladorrhinum sp. PSN332]|nr:hypothetical protein QBC44DRAFT_235129 [Cladorrhinum sp. PSN332]
MAEQARYRYSGAPGRRSPPLQNPGRASLPIGHSPGYPLYSGDIPSMTASHHEGMFSRPTDDYRTSTIPVGGGSYAVRKEPVPRSTSVTDGPREQRTIDSATSSSRPIIITTKHNGPAPRSGSPSRDPYRSSDEGQYYTLPASSISRSRPVSHVPFSAGMDDDDYRRLRERTEHDRAPRAGANDPYRPRPVYPPSGPHRSNTLDFEDEGYEYTKPSDLARYDLDHDRPRRRRESLDRYYRPTVSVTTDLASRPYEQNESRRIRGPPPTTWGLDKVSRVPAAGIYDGAGVRMPALPASAPLSPDLRRAGLHDAPGSPTAGVVRPVALIADAPARTGHYDDYYRDADIRDRDYFHDDVSGRGFGIRLEPGALEDPRRPSEKIYRDERRDYRDTHRDYGGEREERKRADDDLEVVRRDHDERDRDRDREREREREHDFARDRKDARPPSDEEREKSDKVVGNKVAVGIGLAAAGLGLKSAMKGGREAAMAEREREREKERERDREKDISPSKRYRDEDTGRRNHDDNDSYSRSSRKEPSHLGGEDFEIVELPKDREREREREREPPRRESPPETEADRKRPEPDAKASEKGDTGAAPPRDPSSSTDEGKPKPRRRVRASSGFNPNDTAGLAELKAQLAATEDKEKPSRKETLKVVEEPSPERKSSPSGKNEVDPDSVAMVVKDDDRDRLVRVVEPPREKEERKPIKGILKQPKPQFPEDSNPVREGVAPHKDDKTKANVPPGARWTKISRKMVNPEALTIGKERFELRDDFVIVLRVLSKEEIQAYAAATATLRGKF